MVKLHAHGFITHQADQMAKQIHVLLATGNRRKGQKDDVRWLVIQGVKVESFGGDADRAGKGLDVVGSQM